MSVASAAVAAPEPNQADTAPVRVGVVNYINTLPLIDGLSGLRDLDLHPQVPARLVDMLAEGRVELALCSAVDYQYSPVPLQVVPVGMLGCCGPTHTVRLYSRVELGQVRTLACDVDSHTSRALAQVLLARAGASGVRVVDYDRRSAARHPDVDAMLLIGDKVVNDGPSSGEWAHETDLGAAWHAWTGLPFVFAVWMTRVDLSPARRTRVRMAARVLDHQRRHNRQRMGQIVARESGAHGWPATLAHDYLTKLLRFDFDARAAAALERFYAECAGVGLLKQVRPLQIFEW